MNCLWLFAKDEFVQSVAGIVCQCKWLEIKAFVDSVDSGKVYSLVICVMAENKLLVPNSRQIIKLSQ